MPEKLFPVIDISYLTKHFGGDSSHWKQSELFIRDAKIRQLANELRSGFETWGFLYITGHNVPEELIQSAFTQSASFFRKTPRDKFSYARGCGIDEGWLGPENEVFKNNKSDSNIVNKEPSTKRDMKEAFDFRPDTELVDRLSEEMPDFVGSATELFEHCRELALKFLRLLAIALDIDTEEYATMHSAMGQRAQNGTSLRTLFYPQVQQNDPDTDGITKKAAEDERRRISEHTDYGTITLLFQDQVGGLEVQSPSGEFVQAVPIPGTIVINAGDMLKDWSKGQFKATIHRVVIPTRNTDKSRVGTPTDATGKSDIVPARQSMAFFCHPNYDVVIGENEESSYEYLSRRFGETIVVGNEGTAYDN